MTLAGALLSGPLSLALVNTTHPQPAWQGAEVFVRHFHAVQTVPFFLGFVLVGGFLVLVISLALMAPGGLRARAAVAVGLTATFAALVFFNYIVQTTFVPTLARDPTQADRTVLAALTMSNPRSLGWCLEMWAYGILGVATWLVAPVFGGSRLERWTAALFVANGPISVATALLTAFVPGWALTPLGLLGFAVWNLLVMVLAALALLALRRRAAGLTRGAA